MQTQTLMDLKATALRDNRSDFIGVKEENMLVSGVGKSK